MESLSTSQANLLENDLIKIGSIEEQQTIFGDSFPLVLEPRGDKLNFIQLQEYFLKNYITIISCASHHGGVMFKGFDVLSPEEWVSILHKSGLKEMQYIGGSAVRKIIVGSQDRELKNLQVVTTNEAPPSQPIPFHHEMAQTPFPPSHISFYCHAKAISGGSTPIIRSEQIVEWVERNYSDLVPKFEKGVRYTRRVPEIGDPTSPIGNSWKVMFSVNTREEAEEFMKKNNFDWEWVQTEDGTYDCKVISQLLPAIRISSNGRRVFFNQVLASYNGWIDKRNQRGQAVVFYDGTLIECEFIDRLEKFILDNAIFYKWNEGQFIILDNTVAQHSRQPYEGRRIIYASISSGTKEPELNQANLALTSGDSMPALGLGLWKIPNQDCERVVYEAIKSGYRCLDSACDYGNEEEVGLGIKKALSENLIKREQLWITSKLWNTYHRKEHVKAACLRTLKDLGVDYLDLYLIHFPISLKFVPFEHRYPPGWNFNSTPQEQPDMIEDLVPMKETWRAIEKLVEEGLVRNIGICNVGTTMLRDILSYARVKPSVLQVEMHPYNTQEKLLRFCRSKGIAVTAFSNLGAGSYVTLGMATQEDSCLHEQIVKDIAAKYSKTPAQVVLRWGIQRGTQIIPKTTSNERLKENFELWDFNLTAEEMTLISSLNKNRRFNDPGDFCELAFKTFYPIYE